MQSCFEISIPLAVELYVLHNKGMLNNVKKIYLSMERCSKSYLHYKIRSRLKFLVSHLTQSYFFWMLPMILYAEIVWLNCRISIYNWSKLISTGLCISPSNLQMGLFCKTFGEKGLKVVKAATFKCAATGPSF